MRNARLSSTAGFTLVELLVGSTLAGMVMLAVLTTYVTLGRGFTRSLGITSANQPHLEGQARRTLAYFVEDAQLATEITFTTVATASAYSFNTTFTLANNTGTKQVTYYYNATDAAVGVTLNGTPLSMPARSLTRAVYNGSTTTALTLQTNIVSTNEGCYIRYFDSSGSPYDNNAAPYATVTTYPLGMKQASLTFSTQAGNAVNGTLTQVYTTESLRISLRNKEFLR